MEVKISQQLNALAAAFILGFGMGLLYDLLRPVRRTGGKKTAAVIDVLFSLLSGFGLFLFAMSAGSGKLGIWELTFSILGFLTYTYTLSGIIFPMFFLLYLKSEELCVKLRKGCRVLANYMKKNFKKETE